LQHKLKKKKLTLVHRLLFSRVNRGEIFLERRISSSEPLRLALGPSNPPIQLVLGFISGIKAAGAWSWPHTTV